MKPGKYQRSKKNKKKDTKISVGRSMTRRAQSFVLGSCTNHGTEMFPLVRYLVEVTNYCVLRPVKEKKRKRT